MNGYTALLSILLMVHINIILKRRFRLLNETLECSAALALKQGEAIRHIAATHRRLTRLVDHFSRIFGYQIIFIMANAVVVMLESCRSSIRHYDFSSARNVLIVSLCASVTVIAMVF